MIGNDIIDFRQSRYESNWRRSGWVEKLFSQQEQDFILHSKNKETAIWLLWSMKEAVYKIENRIERVQRFAPAKFSCQLHQFEETAAEGCVRYNDTTYWTKSIICKDFIHTISQSAEVKGGSCHTIIQQAAKREILKPHMTLGKDADGIPFIWDKKRALTHDASLSHHGSYLALVFVVA